MGGTGAVFPGLLRTTGLKAALLLVTDGWDAPRVVGAVQKAFRGVKSMAEM